MNRKIWTIVGLTVGWILVSIASTIVMIVPARPTDLVDVGRYFARCAFPFFAGALLGRKDYGAAAVLALMTPFVYVRLTVDLCPLHLLGLIVDVCAGFLIMKSIRI